VFTVRKDILVKTQTNKSKYSMGEEVEMSVTVVNKRLGPVEFIFTSAQRYDFIISKGDEEVWRWSSGKVFAMVLEHLLLKSNEGQTYTETWKPKDATPGEYEVIGVIMSQPPLRATCTFKVDI